MKLNTDKLLLWGSLGTLVIVGIGIIINRERKKKVIGEIETEIKTGGNTMLANTSAFDINYWKTAASDKLITVKAASDLAKDLYSKYAYWGSDDEGIVAIIKQLKTKAQVSQVAFYFKSQTGEDLYSFINRAVDRRFLRIGETPNLDIIQNYILSLK